MESSSTLWKVSLTIMLPAMMQADKPPKPGSPFPESLKPLKRLPSKTRVAGDYGEVELSPWTPPKELVQLHAQPAEFMKLARTTTANSPEKALQDSESLFENVLDDFAFQLHHSIPVVSVDVLDVTPPLVLGESRRVLTFVGQVEYPSPKYSTSQPIGPPSVPILPSIKAKYEYRSEKHRAALRWYVKALTIQFDVDRFALFWISLEILCAQSLVSISKPYVAQCGHEIPACPTCQKPTDREVNGQTIRKYLVDQCGVSAENARELWKARQMFHGSNPLSRDSVKELPRLIHVLKNALMVSLKTLAALGPDEFPKAASDPGMLSPQFGLGGTRVIDSEDLPT